MLNERLILGDACIAEGAAWLAAHDPRFVDALSSTGPLPLRLREGGFHQLLSAIVSQQLSVSAAAAIWARVEKAGVTTPTAIQNCNDEDLRALGLSRQKIGYARALANAGIDFEALHEKPLDDVIAELTTVSGIGVWTAEIYAMFSLHRADVFAHADLALQEAARHLFDLDKRPTPKVMREMADQWRPWRSVAARLLWAYYKHINEREGV
ncbi:MAG: DNA-3-methyladenine glycosylase 2 family protein, partial [Rhodobacteraceae bacterium]|nr:DNA-3-methyladenine glycosylase 2 family protein [Paracoccaceae bacterium]NCZ66749.1 DNA-3-methyladenine glycosylase 2 family protein [Paracoccaceae bacterium]NDI14005.1 DNA-3-methyladenine glycosylase 2 family protein [Paracoccaceae bacterium]